MSKSVLLVYPRDLKQLGASRDGQPCSESSVLTGTSGALEELLVLGHCSDNAASSSRGDQSSSRKGWRPSDLALPTELLQTGASGSIWKQQGKSQVQSPSSSPSPGWVVSFAANHCYGSAADVKDGDRNYQRLLIWVLAGSLSQLLIFHEDESPLPLPLTGTIWVFCLPRERKYMFY